MLRYLLPFVLAAAPACAQTNLVCDLTLKACDYEREEAGSCPTFSPATVSLWAEGETWYLDTTGLTADPANGPSSAEERLSLFNAGDTGDGTWVFYIVDRQGLDGALLLGPDGAAKITLTGDAGPDRTDYQSYFIGQCTGVQP